MYSRYISHTSPIDIYDNGIIFHIWNNEVIKIRSIPIVVVILATIENHEIVYGTNYVTRNVISKTIEIEHNIQASGFDLHIKKRISHPLTKFWYQVGNENNWKQYTKH